jgi:hypothetical protein
MDWRSILPKEILDSSPSKIDNVPPEIEVKSHIPPSISHLLKVLASDLWRRSDPRSLFAIETSLSCCCNCTKSLSKIFVSVCPAFLYLFTSFLSKSLLKFDAFTVAMGCVLLASKIEEIAKSIHEV